MKFERKQSMGVAAMTGAYLIWGVLPIFWKLIGHIPAQEVLAHRIIWAFVFLALILLATGRLGFFWRELREIVARPQQIVGVVVASLLLSGNWLTYIWAVNHDRIVESSLGYFINPLVSILLGVMVLREKASFWQIISFLLATAGVLNLVFHFGTIPWVALVLAISFGLYGLIKKIIILGSITGITLETLIVSPLALTYIGLMPKSEKWAFGLGAPMDLGLLIAAGVITAVPLILFAYGARRLRLSVLGFLQYIAPSLMLILGVYLYHEPFTMVHWVSFTMIWAALTVYSLAGTKFFKMLESMIFGVGATRFKSR